MLSGFPRHSLIPHRSPAVLLEPRAQQPPLDVSALPTVACDKQALQWNNPIVGHDVAALDRLSPGISTEAEAPHAFPHGGAAIDRFLNSAPVVTARESLIGWNTDPPRVMSDGRFGEPQPFADLGVAESSIN
jgi:hypothetical protein